MDRQFGRQNWFSWTKSWQWTATVCPNLAEYLAFPSWYAVKKIPAPAKSSQNPESYRHILQLCETYREAWSVTHRFQTQEGTVADADREMRVKCCKTLLRLRCLLNAENIWFSDEKIFTVQPPINTQNDRVYAATSKKSSVSSRRLIMGCKHFSENRMASVAVSKAGKTSVHFVDKETKVDANYYHETLLRRCLLPEIRQKSGDHFMFQQDGAPSHRAKSTVEFLQRTVPNFIEPSVWSPTGRT